MVRYESFIEDPDRKTRLLLDWLAESVPMAGADAARAQGFVSRDMRHNQTAPADRANEQELTAAQLALYRWLAALPEGWSRLAAPGDLRAEPDSALIAAAEYYDAVADRYGMETAYDTERHKALHFEQATELKDQHIANLEGAVDGLRRQGDQQAERLAASGGSGAGAGRGQRGPARRVAHAAPGRPGGGRQPLGRGQTRLVRPAGGLASGGFLRGQAGHHQVRRPPGGEAKVHQGLSGPFPGVAPGQGGEAVTGRRARQKLGERLLQAGHVAGSHGHAQARLRPLRRPGRHRP